MQNNVKTLQTEPLFWESLSSEGRRKHKTKQLLTKGKGHFMALMSRDYIYPCPFYKFWERLNLVRSYNILSMRTRHFFKVLDCLQLLIAETIAVSLKNIFSDCSVLVTQVQSILSLSCNFLFQGCRLKANFTSLHRMALGKIACKTFRS